MLFTMLGLYQEFGTDHSPATADARTMHLQPHQNLAQYEMLQLPLTLTAILLHADGEKPKNCHGQARNRQHQVPQSPLSWSSSARFSATQSTVLAAGCWHSRGTTDIKGQVCAWNFITSHMLL